MLAAGRIVAFYGGAEARIRRCSQTAHDDTVL